MLSPFKSLDMTSLGCKYGDATDHVVSRRTLGCRLARTRPPQPRSASAPQRHGRDRLAPLRRRVRLGAGRENDPLLPPADEPIAELPEVSTATDAGQVCALHTEAVATCMQQQQLCSDLGAGCTHLYATRLMALGMHGRPALEEFC